MMGSSDPIMPLYIHAHSFVSWSLSVGLENGILGPDPGFREDDLAAECRSQKSCCQLSNYQHILLYTCCAVKPKWVGLLGRKAARYSLPGNMLTDTPAGCAA